MNFKAIKECADRVDALSKRMDAIESRRDSEWLVSVDWGGTEGAGKWEHLVNASSEDEAKRIALSKKNGPGKVLKIKRTTMKKYQEGK